MDTVDITRVQDSNIIKNLVSYMCQKDSKINYFELFIKNTITSLSQSSFNQKHLDKITENINEVIKLLMTTDKSSYLNLFEGAKITSISIKPLTKDKLFINYQLSFDPEPRYTGVDGKWRPLGYYGDYDLYYTDNPSHDKVEVMVINGYGVNSQYSKLLNIHREATSRATKVYYAFYLKGGELRCRTTPISKRN